MLLFCSFITTGTRFSISKLLSDSCEFSFDKILRSIGDGSFDFLTAVAAAIASVAGTGVDSFESLDVFDKDVGVSGNNMLI